MFQKPYYVSHFQDASDALKLVPTAVWFVVWPPNYAMDQYAVDE